MKNYKVDITGVRTNDLKVLTNDETIELFKAFKDGDESARDKIVEGNLKLVLSVMKKFNKNNINSDDLFQVGVVGLIKAVDNFDLSYNLQLSTYAVYLILGEIKKYIRDSTTLRVSRSVKDLAYQIIKFNEEFQINNGFQPKPYDIASALGIDEYTITYALDSLKDPISIFEPIYEDGGDTIYLQDKLEDIKQTNKNTDLLISMNSALKNIDKREKDVLVGRYIIGKTQIELAEEFNISQAQVSRIEKNAINNVRKLIN